MASPQLSESERQSICGLILAGGQGSRMGGKDKGLLPLDEKPLVEHVLTRLRPQVGSIVISANRHQKQYAAFGYPVLSDHLTGAGPLAGIATALQNLTQPYLLTAPCDAPFLPLDLVQRLYQGVQEKNADIAVAHDGTRRQVLFSLMKVELLQDLLTYLDSGERKAAIWQERHELVEVDFSDEADAFSNINTPQSLMKNAERLASFAEK